MDIDKKKSKFYVPEPRWKPETLSGKQIFSGLTIILVAGLFAGFVQKGIDGYGEPSFFGFVSMWVIGIAVAYSLEKVISNLFFPKNERVNDDTSEVSEKSALELQKELENTFYKNQPDELSPNGKQALGEYLERTGQIKE